MHDTEEFDLIEQDAPAEQDFAEGEFAEDVYDAPEDDFVEAEATTPPAAPRGRRARARRAQVSGLPKVMGFLCLLAGAGLIGVLAAMPQLRAMVTGLGIGPMPLFAIGVVLLCYHALLVRLAEQRLELDGLSEGVDLAGAQAEHASQQVTHLVDHGMAAASGNEEMQQALHFIRRQEEKITNLSKATKMYGKPLLEISSQMTEHGRELSELESKLNALKVIVEQSSQRLEATFRESLGSMVVGGGGGGGDAGDTLRIMENLHRDLAQRVLGSSDQLSAEVRDQLRRSSRATEELREDLAADVAKEIDKVSKDLAQIDEHVEAARAGLAEELQQLGTRLADAAQSGGGGGASLPDGALDGMRTELSRLAESISNLQIRASQGGDDGAAKQDAGSGQAKNAGVQNAIAKLKKMRQ